MPLPLLASNPSYLTSFSFSDEFHRSSPLLILEQRHERNPRTPSSVLSLLCLSFSLFLSFPLFLSLQLWTQR